MNIANLLIASSAAVIAGIVSGVVALIVGAIGGILVYKYAVNKKLGNAQAEAAKILEDSRQEAKSMRKEALIEAKEEQHKLRVEVDKEVRERRAEVQRLEQGLPEYVGGSLPAHGPVRPGLPAAPQGGQDHRGPGRVGGDTGEAP